MKKNKFIWLTVAVVATVLSFVSSCKEEEPVNFAPELEIRGTREVLRQSAMLMGDISGNVSKVTEYGFQLSTSDEFPKMGLIKEPVGTNPSTGNFEVPVPGLEAGETYYYRAYATTGAVEVYSPMDQFTTLASSDPRFTYMGSGDPGEDNVTISCRIDEVGDEYLIEYGVQYRLKDSTDPYISVEAENIDEGNHYEVTVTGLSADKVYEFRAYAQNSDTSDGKNGFRIGYGSVIYVTTARQQSAIVTTNPIEDENKGMSSFTVSGLIADAPGSGGAVDSCGFCFSTTSHTPDLADDYVKVDFPGLNKNFKATITGLSMNTTYYVRAFAANTVDGKARFGYGETFEVKTLSLNAPTISWVYDESGHYDVETTPNSIHVSAEIDNFEEGLLTAKGLIWSKTKPYITLEEATTEKTILTLDTKDQMIDGTITGLEMGKYYYVRAYAKFKVGEEEKTGYSGYMQVSTEHLQSAILAYPSVSDITYQSAMLSCVIESEGNGTVKEKGFLISEYYDVSNPTFNTRNTTKYVADGVEFAAKAEGLDYSTYYVLRAYVTTELAEKNDTVYSAVYSFSTEAIQYATFYNTKFVSDSTTYQSVTVNGGINELGDGELIERGFCWYPYSYSNYSYNFESRDSMAVTTGTDADFTLKIEGLEPNTSYCVRAYAKKKAGKYEIVSYDDDYECVSTKSIAGVTFSRITCETDSTTYHSLNVKGGISSLGDGELLEKGFCWYNSNESFESRDSLAVTTGTNADFSLKIDGLDPNTYYYVRSYAKTKVGDKERVYYSSSYGYSTNSFTVSFGSLSTDSVSYTSLVAKSGITALNEGTLVEKGFCWKQGSTPTLDDNSGSMKVETGTMDAFSYKIEGLIPGKSYRVRAYAKVKVGETEYVAYGNSTYVYTTSMEYNVNRMAYDTNCDIEVSFTDNEVPVTAVYVYVTTDYYNSNYWTSNPDLSKSAKFTLTKDENSMKFTGVLDQLKESTTYYYDIYYQYNGQEVYLNYGSFSTGRVPGIDDAVSPDKKE